MSEKENKELNPQEIKEAYDGVSVDWFLQQLVSLANHQGMKAGVTLLIGGNIITGQLIGGKEYFKLFAQSFASAWHEEDRAEIEEGFAKKGDIYDLPEVESRPPQFIHLNNSKIFSPDGLSLPREGMLWRGKLKDVAGFTLGEFSTLSKD